MRSGHRPNQLAGRGFAGVHASPPSGAMITLWPPRRFQIIGMRTVIVWPSNSQFLPATFRFVFPIFPARAVR
jgi:hypothetical protein